MLYWIIRNIIDNSTDLDHKNVQQKGQITVNSEIQHWKFIFKIYKFILKAHKLNSIEKLISSQNNEIHNLENLGIPRRCANSM